MRPWLYTILFLPGAMAVKFLMPHAGGYVNPVMIPPMIAISLFVYSSWNALDNEPKRPTPKKAAFLMLIPLFNLIWMYKAIYPLGKSIQKDAKKYGLSIEVGDAFSRAYCNLQFLSIVFMIIFMSLIIMIMPWPGSSQSVVSNKDSIVMIIFAVISFIPLFLWLIVLHVMFFHYSNAINAIVINRNEMNEKIDQDSPLDEKKRLAAN